MFGTRPKRGLASLPLLRDHHVNINTEEELEEALSNAEVLPDGNDTDSPALSTTSTITHEEADEESASPPPSDNEEPYDRLVRHRASMMRKRKAAEENLKIQAKKMLKTSNEKFPPAQIIYAQSIYNMSRGVTFGGRCFCAGALSTTGCYCSLKHWRSGLSPVQLYHEMYFRSVRMQTCRLIV